MQGVPHSFGHQIRVPNTRIFFCLPCPLCAHKYGWKTPPCDQFSSLISLMNEKLHARTPHTHERTHHFVEAINLLISLGYATRVYNWNTVNGPIRHTTAQTHLLFSFFFPFIRAIRDWIRTNWGDGACVLYCFDRTKFGQAIHFFCYSHISETDVSRRGL